MMQLPVDALSRYAPSRSGLRIYAERRRLDVRYGVRIAGLGLLIPCPERVEIVAAGAICPIPLTPDWFAGMLKVRGNLLPVFDLAVFLGVEPDTESCWLMTVGRGPRAAAIFMDSLPVAVDTGERITDDASPPAAMAPFICFSCRHGGQVWHEVSFNNLFLHLRTQF